MKRPRSVKEQKVKERVIKDDGRYLIFYRFMPPTDSSGGARKQGAKVGHAQERRT